MNYDLWKLASPPEPKDQHECELCGDEDKWDNHFTITWKDHQHKGKRVCYKCLKYLSQFEEEENNN